MRAEASGDQEGGLSLAHTKTCHSCGTRINNPCEFKGPFVHWASAVLETSMHVFRQVCISHSGQVNCSSVAFLQSRRIGDHWMFLRDILLFPQKRPYIFSIISEIRPMLLVNLKLEVTW